MYGKTKKIKKIPRRSKGLIDQIVIGQNENKISKRILPGSYLECFPFPRSRLSKKRDFSIGRSEGNELRLSDSEVSRKHAIVKWVPEKKAYVIYDLQSQNGVYVNGMSCKEYSLKDKDVILIAEHSICYYEVTELVGSKETPPELKGAETTIMKNKSEVVERLRKSLKGDLGVLDIGTVLQMIAGERKTGYIKIEGRDDKGYIHFQDGYIVHSEVNELKGEDAFFCIARWDYGKFEFIADIKPTELSMDEDVAYLLLEIARMDDEQSQKSE
ncbi:DUF4388 domain-containing protein [Candidatus Uabimicrobium sp. HlEnr_7]|uniref:DUF4388 domain-containing protein n=1 Tax=Candidatus Uabimicrobium helgolandensis TaxID=3095367 RepID=UPI0035582834